MAGMAKQQFGPQYVTARALSGLALPWTGFSLA